MAEACETLLVNHAIVAVNGGSVTAECVFTGRQQELSCDTVVPVTARLPNDALYLRLKVNKDAWQAAGVETVSLLGDAYAPGTIAAAVYSGHKHARNLEADIDEDAVPFRREMPEIERGDIA